MQLWQSYECISDLCALPSFPIMSGIMFFINKNDALLHIITYYWTHESKNIQAWSSSCVCVSKRKYSAFHQLPPRRDELLCLNSYTLHTLFLKNEGSFSEVENETSLCECCESQCRHVQLPALCWTGWVWWLQSSEPLYSAASRLRTAAKQQQQQQQGKSR